MRVQDIRDRLQACGANAAHAQRVLRLWVNALPADMASKGVDDPSVLSELHARGLTYVYIGNRDGRVNNAAGPHLEGEQFSASSHYRLVYREDRVWIFEVLE